MRRGSNSSPPIRRKARQAPIEREPGRRLGGRSARVRTSVLDAALIVLTSKGFEAFTVSEVAERAGVHETSIYRRWGTRTSLALEACLRFADEALPIPDTGSLRSDLIELLKSVTQLLKSPQGQALLSVSMSIDPEIITVRKTYWKARFALASKIFERASTRGEFPAGASGDELLEALIAPLYFRSFVTIAPLEDWPTSEMIDRLFASYKA